MATRTIRGTEPTSTHNALLISIGSALLCLAIFGSITAIFISLWLAIPTALAILVGASLILWTARGDAFRSRSKKTPYL